MRQSKAKLAVRATAHRELKGLGFSTHTTSVISQCMAGSAAQLTEFTRHKHGCEKGFETSPDFLIHCMSVTLLFLELWLLPIKKSL